MCNHLLHEGKSKAYSKSYLKCKCLLHFKELNKYERLAFKVTRQHNRRIKRPKQSAWSKLCP